MKLPQKLANHKKFTKWKEIYDRNSHSKFQLRSSNFDALRGCSYEADSWTYRPIVPVGSEQLIATTPVIYMQQVHQNG